MASKESDYPSPQNYESGEADEEEPERQPVNNNVANILARLQSSGALVRKPKKELYCFSCKLDFAAREHLIQHLLQHVTLPSVELVRLDDDDVPSGEDDWLDEDDATMAEAPKIAKTPHRADISQMLKSRGVYIKTAASSPDLHKLSELGLTIKSKITPIKTEQPESSSSDARLGGIKLTLKSDGSNSNTFKVVNGLRDFKNSDDEDDAEEYTGVTPGDDEGGAAEAPVLCAGAAAKPRGRPAVKQTPTRANLQSQPCSVDKGAEPERCSSSGSAETVVVKKEVDCEVAPPKLPLFAREVKKERASPALADSSCTPLLGHIKAESAASAPPAPKSEEPVAVIEINGDSNDEDDDCCVVSTTPAPDVKPPVAPKVEEVAYPLSTDAFSMAPKAYGAAKQSFDWTALDAKPADALEKSADDIFGSLEAPSKRDSAPSDASEYISLDRLGVQHACDVCSARFADADLLEEHRKVSGHSQSLVLAAPALQPYNPTSHLMSRLLPVTNIADQVGKLSMRNGSGFSHQQNVMINIQAYPGTGGLMMPAQPQPYNAFPNTSDYAPPSTAYGADGRPAEGQYPPGTYMDSNMPYAQYQAQVPKSNYSGTVPPSSLPSQSPYSASSPLQAMQQAVYGQAGMMNQPGHPSLATLGSMPMQAYPPVSSPSRQLPVGNGLNIQNVQTFPPGAIPCSGPAVGQMPPPPLKMYSGPTGSRMRLPNVRFVGQKAPLRPGGQLQAPVRGVKIAQRTPVKRVGVAAGGPASKRRPDALIGKQAADGCQVMAMPRQREGLPLIHSVQGAQVSVTKKRVNKAATAMASVLVSRGISVKQKPKSRSPTPERPIPHIPNLGPGVSIKHSSKPRSFSIPEAKVGGDMTSCKICRKMFGSQSSLQVHMANAHPQSKVPTFRCDDCPASYPTSLQLQHHKRVFHNVNGADKLVGLPVVDFSLSENRKRLNSLGIYNFIPLVNREQVDGTFVLPIVSIRHANSSETFKLEGLGANGMLTLGPIKLMRNA